MEIQELNISDKFIVSPKVFSGLKIDCKQSSSRKHARQIFIFSVFSIFVLKKKKLLTINRIYLPEFLEQIAELK